jgi:cyanophycinase
MVVNALRAFARYDGRMLRLMLLLASAALAAEHGPERGALVIIGGGAVGPEIWQRIQTLAGGADAPVVYVPTADEREPREDAAAYLKRAGFTDVTVVHTRDPKVADTDAFVAPIRRAKAVFFGGGRQWRIVDAYGGTKAEAEFAQVLERGGVIAGSSAGATIQGSYLVRGDTKNNTTMMSPGHERGFGYLRKAAIDQHLIVRKRENDLWPVLEKHPELLGVGIDESTAIVVRGDEAEVVGKSKVALYRHGNAPKQIWLGAGERVRLTGLPRP